MTRLSWSWLVFTGLWPLSGLACHGSNGSGPDGGTPTGGSTTGGITGIGGQTGTGGRPAPGGGGAVGAGGAVRPPSGVVVPGVSIPEEQRQAYEAVRAELAQSRPADAQQFIDRWRPSYLTTLPYDPAAAVNLPLIQASTIGLNQAELTVLSARGFVISGRQQFPTFFEGYRTIYATDLPLFVSADSVLHAVHRSYDGILLSIERTVLIPTLGGLLATMHAALPAFMGGGWSAEALADVDEYLTVARRLLGVTSARPVAGGRADAVNALVTGAEMASGLGDVMLFGEKRQLDFSQFQPRGHYAGDPLLEKYFRATMWLGRTDLRTVMQTISGEIQFDRRQFAAALLIADLVNPIIDQWKTLDDTLRGFVGESDNMLPSDFARLRQNLGATSAQEILAKSDQELAQAIVSGGFGIQRIASQILYVDPENEGAPLDRAFLLLGQRFVIDSQVLSNVVYDRLKRPPYRMMPSPLDVAFGALGNSRAVDLLQGDLRAHPDYPGALHDARRLVDQHERAFWQESLYGGWLAALRAVSPPQDVSNPASANLPAVAATDGWARRLLQTQLASWTELRHDTLLYAKQSYTGIPTCEFPDAYVEPVPAFWNALADFGRRGEALAASLDLTAKGVPNVGAYFSSLAATTTVLKDMADRQIAGQPFSAQQLAFINEAVELKSESAGCATIQRPAGWYPRLFFQPDDSQKQDTIVADVHTQPGDDGGNIVGRILHVGTGFPRLMVTTFETCTGPHAYAGVVSSYFETTTQNFDRLTDARWTTQLSAAPPAPISWMNDLVAH